MSSLNETPSANRIHIAFFGLRNAGKSTLVNAFTNQNIAIVSDVAGTTTDPVSKAMEILPLGPCLITDTAGLDDVGELGAMRVEKTLAVLATTDVAVWVHGAEEEGLETPQARTHCGTGAGKAVPPEPRPKADAAVRPCVLARSVSRQRFDDACAARKITVLEYHRGESVEGLKAKIAALKLVDETPGLLDGLVEKGDLVVCVCPIDESAPKGRLILPQVQVIRDCLDRHLACTVCQVEELSHCLKSLTPEVLSPKSEVHPRVLVITDSQAFAEVSSIVSSLTSTSTSNLNLTSFSILFARQKGDLAAYKQGLAAIANLKDGDRVLIAEGCTHHRQCNDIGAVKIPKALAKLTGGKKLEIEFASGQAFPVPPSVLAGGVTKKPVAAGEDAPRYGLVIQCGGCMLTRREMLRRIGLAREAGIPIVNYGLLLATAAGVEVEKCVM